VDTLHLDVDVPLRDVAVRAQLDVEAETVALVGPSGAGKTTVLRAVAGLVRPRGGRITLGDEVWFDAARGVHLPPERRSLGYVFQHYALFPHLSVRANVAYGAREPVEPLLERFGLGRLARARPREISGGERQRVALARALARRPRVLLLDEPLSALDPDTRAGVRNDLREVLAGLRLPTLLVTHDFHDAAALASRVGVLQAGQLVQLDTAAALLRDPADAFVARLTGANVLPGVSVPGEDGVCVVTLVSGGSIRAPGRVQGSVDVVVPPWEVSLGDGSDPALNTLTGVVGPIVELGGRLEVRVGPISALLPVGVHPPDPGSAASVRWPVASTRLLARG
jgi:ABC-type sulfate/molybdate transport systems ATPase subunit